MKELARRWKAAQPHVRSVRTMAIIFFFALGILGVRLIDLQFIRADALAASADAFRTRTYTLQAKRGDIVDTNGAVLATSVERYNVGVNQNLIGSYQHYKTDDNGDYVLDANDQLIVEGTGAAEAAKVLAPLLGVDRAELGGTLLGGEKKSTFVYIARDISKNGGKSTP